MIPDVKYLRISALVIGSILIAFAARWVLTRMGIDPLGIMELHW